MMCGVCRHPNYLEESSVFGLLSVRPDFLARKTLCLDWIRGDAGLVCVFSVPALDKKLMESKTDYEEYKKSVWGLIR